MFYLEINKKVLNMKFMEKGLMWIVNIVQKSVVWRWWAFFYDLDDVVIIRFNRISFHL